MTGKKLKIGVVFGGKSAEHEVSLMSAQNVLNALDKTKYSISKIKIQKDGEFSLSALKKVDVIFPVLHGPYGEDGIMQGLFKILDKPFVGASVLGSAIGMDKDVMKRLLKEADIPVGKFLVKKHFEKISYQDASKKLGKIMFIKPANMGSSVGVHRVKNEKEFNDAVKDAFRYDSKIILEEYIDGQEVECSVLGNDDPVASSVGEIVPGDDFYSYDAKYINASETLLQARIDKKTEEKIKELAVKTFQVLSCEGLGRVDFLLRKNGEVLVNEINTLPGFTNISMYPKLWEASGLSQTKLLDKLINLSLERYKKEKKLKTTY